MDEAEKAIEVAKLLAEATMTFGNLSDGQVQVYMKVLMPYDLERITFACNQVIRTYHYNNMPKPADFLRHMGPGPDAVAEQALMKVKEMIRRHGRNATVAFDDPVIHQIIMDYGGWPSFNDSYSGVELGYENLWDKDFRRKYTICAQVPDHKEIPVRLLGEFDIANISNPHATASETKRLPSDIQTVKALTHDG